MPKKPESRPTPKLTGTVQATIAQPSRTGFSGDGLRRSIAMATTIISKANRNSNALPGKIFPICAPSAAANAPGMAKAMAGFQRTLPARQCGIKLMKAVSATASAVVPMTTCGF